MDYKEVLEKARGNIGPYCKACPVCNGKACGNSMPGPGSKGPGNGAARNYDAWQKVFVNMDTICSNAAPDTSFKLFGREFALPVFTAPIGALPMHYSDAYDDFAYNDILIPTAVECGSASFTGDGVDPAVMEGATQAIRAQQGCGVPTVKPWDRETLMQKLDLALTAGPMAIAMDIDAAGLPFLRNRMPPAGSKTVEQLKEIADYAGVPFILKGIMTVKGAEKAVKAGAKAIIVSNHGGRVLDQCPATAEVLPEIVDAVGKDVMVLVDGGIRTGMDVFKALALGAKGVLIARPFVNMVYGGGEEGPAVLVAKLKAELEDTMLMCGAHSLAEIDRSMVR